MLEYLMSLQRYHDLRAHIEALEKHGLLIRVKHPINKDTELHPLVRLQFRGLPEETRKAFLFENVHDSRGKKFVTAVLVGGLAASEEIYALGLQCHRNEIADRWQKALGHPIKPELVKTGKVKEVIH